MQSLTVERSIVIDAEPSLVFRALTEPALIVQAFPLRSAEVQHVAGGTVTLSGETREGPFTDHGVVEVFETPSRFRYRYWSTNHGTARTPENEMSIDYRVARVPGGAELRVLHENLLTEARQQQMGPVWDFLLAGVKRCVESLGNNS